MGKLHENIIIVDSNRKKHSKASEEYIHVVFQYQEGNWEGWVPVEYRRTGTHIETTVELHEHLNKVYEQMNPKNFAAWFEKQEKFWKEEKPRAAVTKGFFDGLVNGGWKCVECDLPTNPNWARRIQDLKEFGYTLATNTNAFCATCNANKTHLILLPIDRGGVGESGYETWTPKLRKRIINLLGSIDVYENKINTHCLPDHKFSEIRWDKDTKAENPDNMSDAEIRQKFQLLTNQRNQQKREVCRSCYQTGKRGVIFGIPFYYEGDENWDDSIPIRGKEAERGCVGCPWYDIAEWRKQVIVKLNEK